MRGVWAIVQRDDSGCIKRVFVYQRAARRDIAYDAAIAAGKGEVFSAVFGKFKKSLTKVEVEVSQRAFDSVPWERFDGSAVGSIAILTPKEWYALAGINRR